jgi:hypothetical protein
MIEDIIARLVSIGVDLTSIGAVKRALKLIGEDEALADLAYILIKDRAYRSEWRETPPEKRVLFLPQCLRDSKNCEAHLTETGYVCKECGKCVIPEIVSYARSLGMEHIYIVPGGSMVYRILKRLTGSGDSWAVMGVACVPELREAVERVAVKGLPMQCVPLRKEGCVDTEVDTMLLKTKLRAGLRHLIALTESDDHGYCKK